MHVIVRFVMTETSRGAFVHTRTVLFNCDFFTESASISGPECGFISVVLRRRRMCNGGTNRGKKYGAA